MFDVKNHLDTIFSLGLVAWVSSYFVSRHNKLEDSVNKEYKNLSHDIEVIRREQIESAASRDQRLIALEVTQQTTARDIEKLEKKLDKTLDHINNNIKGVYNAVIDRFKDEK